MKMILFRPAFVAASMVALSSLFLSPVSAMPQFGRPLFWALDDVPSESGVPAGPAGFVDPDPVPQQQEQQQQYENATDHSVLAQNGNSTSGALHHLGGGIHVPVALVVSAAASAAFLAF